MAKFILSAFSDELSPDFDEQVDYLSHNGFDCMEVRGVNGTPVADITLDTARELRKKLDAASLGVSAVGSPVGKIRVDEDFDEHLKKAEHVFEIANILGTQNIRAFSFYIPQGKAPAEYRDEVMRRIGILADTADKYGVLLCMENEKAIYGESAENMLDIFRTFDGRVKCVFDHANFISSGIEPYPYAFELLRPYIHYMHIKDADVNAEMVRAGEGIGRIPETINELKKTDKTWILTLEPHLMEFQGLSGLEQGGHQSRLQNKYTSPREAFDAAAEALKEMIK